MLLRFLLGGLMVVHSWLEWLLMMTLARTTMGWAPRFLRQISTQEEPLCNSPYVAVSTMEAGSWGFCAGSASTWTHIQCPQASVWPWIFMVPNEGMVTLHVVQMFIWMPLCTVELGVIEGGVPFLRPPSPMCSQGATGVTQTRPH